jgi:hypothetical protein
MHQGTDAAGPLGDEVRVSWIASLENDFKTPEKRTRAPGVFDLSVLYFNLDSEVTLYSWDGVNYDSSHFIAPFERVFSRYEIDI